MKQRKLAAGAALASAFMALAAIPSVATAAVVSIVNPGGSTEIGARIRWGATGWEAGIRDSGTETAVAQLNPPGTPFWALNQGYGFKIEYTVATGTLWLGVDFDRNSSFGAGEFVSASSFPTAPGLTSYAGQGFDFLQISGNESGSTARSSVSNLMINGTSFASGLTPNGTLLDTFYDDSSGGATPWLITGTLTFTTSGTSQERPSWNFSFRSPNQASVVPEPGTLALLGLGLAGLAASRRRKQ